MFQGKLYVKGWAERRRGTTTGQVWGQERGRIRSRPVPGRQLVLDQIQGQVQRLANQQTGSEGKMKVYSQRSS